MTTAASEINCIKILWQLMSIKKKGVKSMQFKELEWKEITSDGDIVCSHCEINLCGVIKIEFRINHEPREDKYYLYCFSKGNLRKLQPEKYDSVESAKNVAYKIYSNEMARIKKAVDYLVADSCY